MKIALLGFDFFSPNKGCEALTYTFVSMLNDLKVESLEIHVFGSGELGLIPNLYQNIKFVGYRLRMKRLNYWKFLVDKFKEMDCIFDITFGDGFSDIYGKVWNANTNMAKQLAIKSGTPFVLLPQTYGPYSNVLLKRWAIHIVKKSAYAFSRDQLSSDEMQKLGCTNVVATTDLAFALPYNKRKYSCSNNKLKIGFNVSSLLWEGGHNIQLATDYQEYCRYIVGLYSSKPDTEIHIIAHVIDTVNSDALENDCRVCNILKKEFPNAILAPDFSNPIDAKSYISNMDVFIGARMHSTIASMSSGVPTIPFSYSKKFEGLYDSLQYPYVISATKIGTADATKLTEKYVQDRDLLEEERKRAICKVSKKLDFVKKEMGKLVRRKSKN